MARIRFEVESYSVSLHRGLAWNLGGQGVVHTASILCRGSGADELVVGFQPEGEAITPNYYDAARKRGYLIRPASEFGWYVDLLRNEKPLFAVIHDDRPAFMYLSVSGEPVGEGEVTAV